MDKTFGAHVACRGQSMSLFLYIPAPTDSMQRALANQPWKEYTAEGGRKYWYNTESKQSSWQMPEDYKNAMAQAAPAPKSAMP